jgi:hypothetical protein
MTAHLMAGCGHVYFNGFLAFVRLARGGHLTPYIY